MGSPRIAPVEMARSKRNCPAGVGCSLTSSGSFEISATLKYRTTSVAATICCAFLGTSANAPRKWTRHRCHAAPWRIAAICHLQSTVRTADQQPHSVEATYHQTAQEREPEVAFSLGRYSQAEHLTCVTDGHADGDHNGLRHHPTGLFHFHKCRVRLDVGGPIAPLAYGYLRGRSPRGNSYRWLRPTTRGAAG
jgi:hypothetical protein